MTHTQLFIHRLQQPQQMEVADLDWLEEIVDEYPYFQSARALYLKGLHQQKSHLYNAELKKTAAYTEDRDVLFDFIISDEFVAYQPIVIEDIKVNDADCIPAKKPEPTLEENIEKSILSSLAYVENPEKENPLLYKKEQKNTSTPEKSSETEPLEHHQQQEAVIEIEEKLDIGAPLHFNTNEKHSFADWLKLTKAQPIVREEENQPEQEASSEVMEQEQEQEREKKRALIDRFIATNPKITPSKHTGNLPVFIEEETESQPYLMTETLAKIYLEQKKYQKAIQAYEILILKYPEKSSLFADRIQDIKMLQQYNS